MQTLGDSELTQKDLLKARYTENSSYFDALALYFGSWGWMLKIPSYLTIAAGLGLSIFLFNPVMISLFSIATGFLGLLHHQCYTLNQRFELMYADLEVSEKKLRLADVVNRDLESQLSQAFRTNFGVLQQLEQSRVEIEVVTQNARLKEQEVERSKERIDEVVAEVNILTQELNQQKRIYSDKLTSFFALLENTAQVMDRSCTGPRAKV